jgi:hypothetical protein
MPGSTGGEVSQVAQPFAVGVGNQHERGRPCHVLAMKLCETHEALTTAR